MIPEAQTPETAHVLFMDLVGYSKLPMNEQVELSNQLLKVVRDSPAFKQAPSSDLLLRLPTGDGMALVFFQDLMLPVRCALEIADRLRVYPAVKLRMGIHSGPVYRLLDINDNMNVSGGGINLAQRVMDAGDAGHILVSRSAADFLLQLGGWQEHLRDLGELEVKHGVRIHLFNLCRGGLGNPDLPSKMRVMRPSDEGRAKPIFTLISVGLHRRCRELFKNCEEFRSTESLRPLFETAELHLFEHCVGRSVSLELDQLIACLLRSGRTSTRPALLDLLEMLTSHYEGDHRGRVGASLIEDLKKEIAQHHASGGGASRV